MSNWGSGDLVSDFAQWNKQSNKMREKQGERGQSNQGRSNRNQNWQKKNQDGNNYSDNNGNNGNSWNQKPSGSSWNATKDNNDWNTAGNTKEQAGWNTVEPKKEQGGWNTVEPKKEQAGWSRVEPKKEQGGWNTAEPKKQQAGWNTAEPKEQRASGWSTVASNSWNKAEPKKEGTSASNWNNTSSTKPPAPSSNSWNQEVKGAVKNDWNTPTSSTSSTGDWNSTSSKKSEAPAANSWNQDSNTTTNSGWDTPASNNSSGGAWGSMTLESLGWNDTGKKSVKKEDGRGYWKDGVHHLSEPNEKLEIKLFGTADDKEVQHSGINFDKYDNIPVETNGEDVSPIEKFTSPPLDKDLIRNIELARYKTPTPVQKYSVPIVLSGRDLMACAQTGSGKTAGFLFPIISSLFTHGPIPNPEENKEIGFRSHKKAYPQALILAPTRELASQIYAEAKKFCYRSFICPCVAYGGADIQAQLRLIDRGCHLLVATPGRLVDILERRRISFKNIQYLVLDEADRMLDMGFEPQIRRIVEGEDMPSPSDRQNLLFSATFPENIQILARDFMKDYVFLSVGRVGATSENIQQRIELVHPDEKRDKLLEILETDKGGLTLIFTETKRMADAICEFLIDNRYRATAIHGDRVQSEREAALASFKKGETPIMVATAVASRGLDIPNVTHVISFDLPKDIDDYVHRIGRTGRAGNTGLATALFTKQNSFISADLVKLLTDAHQPVPEWLKEMASEPVDAQPPNRGFGRGRSGGGSRHKEEEFGLRIRSYQMK